MSRRPAQRGSATIEFAVLFLPLAMLTFAVTEAGRAMYQYNALAKSVRSAARFQSSATPGDTLRSRCIAVTGSPETAGANCAGTPILPGLTLDHVTACDRLTCPADHNLQPTGSGVVNLVTITITGYPFTSMAPFAMPSVAFGPIAATMVQPI